MKLLTYASDSGPRAGLLVDDNVVVCRHAHEWPETIGPAHRVHLTYSAGVGGPGWEDLTLSVVGLRCGCLQPAVLHLWPRFNQLRNRRRRQYRPRRPGRATSHVRAAFFARATSAICPHSTVTSSTVRALPTKSGVQRWA